MIKKIFLSIIIVILSFIFIIFIGLLSYKIIFSQKKIESFEINTPNFDKHILIASQGSKFKNQLVKIFSDELKMENFYIKVIDVSLLKNIKISNWQSIIIINAIESGKLEKNVDNFIQKNSLYNNIILVITSGSGKFMLKDYDIDAISTASRMKNIENIKNLIIDRIIL